MARGKYQKRDEEGFHQFEYYGVSAKQFGQAMKTGLFNFGKAFGGKRKFKKITKPASTIDRVGNFTAYTLAVRIPKRKRYVR
tara:strand:- start:104 stop:349 length:246 start_codon:yes stop_codon:yes gene_type:complete